MSVFKITRAGQEESLSQTCISASMYQTVYDFGSGIYKEFPQLREKISVEK